MAHYAKISNEEFTVNEIASLGVAYNQKWTIEADNRASEEYAALKIAYEDSLSGSEAEQKTALDNLNAKESEGTEDLVAEIETLNTAIANALCRVTAMYTGADEFTSSNGEVTEEDNTVYWEGYYGGCKRTSYNTRGGVHTLGGTPFRKNYAGVGHIYDPVRDAFYTEQPYASWTLDESTCYWQAPTPRPEEGQWYWNEATLEWVEHPYKRYKSWVWGNKLTSWNGYYEGDEPINDWFAPIECPDVSELSYSKRLSSYIWNEDTLTWVEL